MQFQSRLAWSALAWVRTHTTSSWTLKTAPAIGLCNKLSLSASMSALREINSSMRFACPEYATSTIKFPFAFSVREEVTLTLRISQIYRQPGANRGKKRISALLFSIEHSGRKFKHLPRELYCKINECVPRWIPCPGLHILIPQEKCVSFCFRSSIITHINHVKVHSLMTKHDSVWLIPAKSI